MSVVTVTVVSSSRFHLSASGCISPYLLPLFHLPASSLSFYLSSTYLSCVCLVSRFLSYLFM